MKTSLSSLLALGLTFLSLLAACTTTTTDEVKKPIKVDEPVDPGKTCDTTADCQTRFGEGWVCENKRCENVTERVEDIAENEATEIPGVLREAQLAFREGVQATLSSPPEYDRGLAAFEKAAEIDPRFLEAYFNIGTVYEKKGQADKALDAYQRAIRANPDNPDAKAFVGKIYLAKAKGLIDTGKQAEADSLLNKAKSAFDEVIAQDFENVPANNGLALYWLLKGDAGQAEENVKQVLIIEPENVTALNTRGLVFLKAGKLNFAEWIFKQKVLGLDPNSVEAHTNLGTVYVRTNQLPLAVQHFSSSIKLDPANVPAHLNLGKIYLEYLNYGDAKDRFTSALKLDPGNVEAIVGLGTAELGLNAFDEAIAAYDKAVKADSRRANLYEEIGKLYEKKGSEDDVCKTAVGYYKKYVAAGQLPSTHPISQKVTVLEDACKQGLFKAPSEEPKLPDEGGDTPADPAAEPAPGDAPKAPEGEKLPEPPPPATPGKDGAPGVGAQ